MIEKNVTPYEYFDDPVNTTLINERGIEIPLGIRYLDRLDINNVVEVGCVMPFYGYCEHLIVDQFEKDNPAGEVLNVDAMTFDFSGRDILCLSTIEHVGRSDYENEDVRPEKAIEMLDKFDKEAKSFLVSWGIGYHLELDAYVKENLDRFDWWGFVKTAATEWEFTDQDMKLFDGKFDSPFRYSNSNIFLSKGIELV
tara:strand:+ start:1994 stop:2584 length:591 start_codon:yes stop_codon:yes gene_type:complete